VSKKAFCLRNHGCMPATCLFEYQGSDDFRFSSRNASLTLQPGQRGELSVSFAPRTVSEPPPEATVRVSVLNNQFDHYTLKLKGTAYACDAMIDTDYGASLVLSHSQGGVGSHDAGADSSTDIVLGDKSFSSGISGLLNAGKPDVARAQDDFTLPEITLPPAHAPGGDGDGDATAPPQTSYTVLLRSRVEHPVRFNLSAESPALSFSPKVGHLGAHGTREVVVTFTAAAPVSLLKVPVKCALQRIAYPEGASGGALEEGSDDADQRSLHGAWDDAMTTLRPASAEEAAAVDKYEAEERAYHAAGAEQGHSPDGKGGSKGKGPSGPPQRPAVQVAGRHPSTGTLMVYAHVPEPAFEAVKGHAEQAVTVTCTAVADAPKFTCEAHNGNVNFRPTYMLQSCVHRVLMSNDSNVALPVKWALEDIKRRSRSAAASVRPRPGALSGSAAQCPFSIEPAECIIPPKSTKEFKLTFLPLDADDFVYLLTGDTTGTGNGVGMGMGGAAATMGAPGEGPPDDGIVRMVLRGSAKRPVCHFELKETPDYLSRRAGNLKNEHGMLSPIECADLKVVELESTGLRTRNTFRFHIINPTADNFDFLWEAVGEPSPFWRCVQSAGMLFAGKRIEMVFEYLPDEVAVAETFFKFKLVQAGLEQMFLFAGKVRARHATPCSAVDAPSHVLSRRTHTPRTCTHPHTHERLDRWLSPKCPSPPTAWTSTRCSSAGKATPRRCTSRTTSTCRFCSNSTARRCCSWRAAAGPSWTFPRRAGRCCRRVAPPWCCRSARRRRCCTTSTCCAT
jgi:hypothetical protein